LHATTFPLSSQQSALAGAEAVSTGAPPAPLESLFEEASKLIHRTAWRITGSPADAEDVLQTVFLQLMRKCPPAPWPDNPMGYIHRAAVNASLDLLRQRKRRPESPIEFDLARDEGRSAEDAAISRLGSAREVAQLREAMEVLSPLEAEAFSLRYLEEHDNAEVAEILGKTSNHVRVTLHAARRKVRERLEELVSPSSCSAKELKS
jgi:RNA polymerase sigma factor (sigma-70 family)